MLFPWPLIGTTAQITQIEYAPASPPGRSLPAPD